jgi:hypothetical protein
MDLYSLTVQYQDQLFLSILSCIVCALLYRINHTVLYYCSSGSCTICVRCCNRRQDPFVGIAASLEAKWA